MNCPADRPLVCICFVQSAIKKAREKGLDWTDLLQSSSIDPRLLEQADARIPAQHYATLLTRTMRAMRDESLGYSQQPYKPGAWATACRAAVHPGPLGHALRRLCRFYSLFDWGLRICLSVQGEDAIVEAAPASAELEYEAFAYESFLFAIHRFASWLINEMVPLKEVTLRHSRPAHAAEYRWLFQGSPVFFQRPCAALRFDRKLLDKPLQRDERALAKFLNNSSHELLDVERSLGTWGTRVRELAGHNLPALPEFEMLADQLQIHPQTLRRRLASEGLTYKEIKDEIRREVAEYHLRERALSIEEIAFRCGFSEASAFIRAFRRWNGVTPHAYAERPCGTAGVAGGRLPEQGAVLPVLRTPLVSALPEHHLVDELAVGLDHRRIAR